MSETALAELRPHSAASTLFGTDDPEEVITGATQAARALAEVIRKQKLTTRIAKREHVRVEGWTLLGSMLGVFPVVSWTERLENGWKARVEARTRAGELVGAAEAECLYSEANWVSRDDYALLSMAQTRATSKALKMPLGFVMHLAGFDTTPAEEMVAEKQSARSQSKAERPAEEKNLLSEIKARYERLSEFEQELGVVEPTDWIAWSRSMLKVGPDVWLDADQMRALIEMLDREQSKLISEMAAEAAREYGEGQK